ncbi:MAG: hypothetical protein JW904_09020 [Spirochaetales bacterium]|nr:hypothetical protein [Spirochaetales bacterium]
MLKEGADIRQRPEEGFRRWFFGKNCELILWYDRPDGELTGFQWCYDQMIHQKAFSYFEGKKSHRFVTEGLTPTGRDAQMTGILMGDAGEVDPDVMNQFIDAAESIDPDTVDFVLCVMREYNNRFEK